jgi:hypothetical protein
MALEKIKANNQVKQKKRKIGVWKLIRDTQWTINKK